VILVEIKNNQTKVSLCSDYALLLKRNRKNNLETALAMLLTEVDKMQAAYNLFGHTYSPEKEREYRERLELKKSYIDRVKTLMKGAL
jgi:hypothetical protein